jgi:hypothetical protein
VSRFKLSVLAGLILFLIVPASAQMNSTIGQPAKAAPFPAQLQMRVPFGPTAFASAGRTYLVYELYLTNFSGISISVSRLEVLDAQARMREVAAFSSSQLDGMIQPAGGAISAGTSLRQISPGGTAIIFMWIAFDPGARVPQQLLHRIILANAAIEGAAISTHTTPLNVLAPPVTGSDWLASDGPGNSSDNHHRRGIFVIGGRVSISRRYAIDWMRSRTRATFSGDPGDVRSYYAYDQPVFAVADGKVISTRDDIPNNVPGHGTGFRSAVPITLDTVQGNNVTLDLGNGQYAYYMHLRPGSLRVKLGDRVRRGQMLAHVGASGDAREPHLHLEITNSPEPLAGEGIPYVIGHYRIQSSDGAYKTDNTALPLNNMIVTFGDAQAR